MTTTARRTFAQRIGYLITCVIPAALLSDGATEAEDTSSLRADASQNGLSFAHITQSLEEGIYLARVAASPDQVSKGYTVLLTEQDLYFALPWDLRLSRFLEKHEDRRQPQPESILALIRAHAAEIQPPVKVAAPEARTRPQPVPATVAVTFEAKHAQTVEISAEDLQEVLGLPATDTTKDAAAYVVQKSTYHMQQAFLRAAIDTLMRKLYQGQDRAHALTIKAKCALVARVQRWHRQTRQQVVNAVLALDRQKQQMTWQLTIGIPAMADLAA